MFKVTVELPDSGDTRKAFEEMFQHSGLNGAEKTELYEFFCLKKSITFVDESVENYLEGVPDDMGALLKPLIVGGLERTLRMILLMLSGTFTVSDVKLMSCLSLLIDLNLLRTLELLYRLREFPDEDAIALSLQVLGEVKEQISDPQTLENSRRSYQHLLERVELLKGL